MNAGDDAPPATLVANRKLAAIVLCAQLHATRRATTDKATKGIDLAKSFICNALGASKAIVGSEQLLAGHRVAAGCAQRGILYPIYIALATVLVADGQYVAGILGTQVHDPSCTGLSYKTIDALALQVHLLASHSFAAIGIDGAVIHVDDLALQRGIAD